MREVRLNRSKSTDKVHRKITKDSQDEVSGRIRKNLQTYFGFNGVTVTTWMPGWMPTIGGTICVNCVG